MQKGFVVQPFKKFWNLLCTFEYVMLFDAWYFENLWLTTNQHDLNSQFSIYPMVANYIAHLIAA
jgi:hypothetical protein